MNEVDRYRILVRYLVDKKIATTQKELGAKLGYTNESSFSQVINGKVRRPKEFISKIKDLLPELNEVWLLTGEGEMLKSSITQTSGDHSSNIANSEVSYSDSKLLEKALDEVTEMRKLVQEQTDLVREQVSINKAQTDRFLTLIERLTTP